MKRQDYSNHIFYYWPHHFFFYGSVIAAWVLCGIGYRQNEAQHILWLMMAVLVFLIVWLAFMTRQHYALGLQNRTVRLELRLRYYIVTGKRLETVEEALSFGQLAALRFAPDGELAALVERAMAEKLSAKEIKRIIKNWLPDTMRV